MHRDQILCIRRISDFKKVLDSVGLRFGIRHIPNDYVMIYLHICILKDGIDRQDDIK